MRKSAVGLMGKVSMWAASWSGSSPILPQEQEYQRHEVQPVSSTPWLTRICSFSASYESHSSGHKAIEEFTLHLQVHTKTLDFEPTTPSVIFSGLSASASETVISDARRLLGDSAPASMAKPIQSDGPEFQVRGYQN
eukprot:m.109480 g.109480  ORF g.109480 m.109480 type:complete len:137 (-) comp12848_c0_seq2:1397-1807(-)